jgi:hypothetical protein
MTFAMVKSHGGGEARRWIRAVPFTATMLLAAGVPSCQGDTAILEADPTGQPPADATPATTAVTTPPASEPQAPPSSAQPSDTPAVTAELGRDLMARWNAVVPAADSTFDFHWRAFEQFPHPTYKGGSAEAYRAFATLLLAFFQQGDDFDFLARNHLFGLELVYVFPSGANGLSTNFAELAASFAAPDGYGAIPADTRQALQAIADRIASTK